MLRRTVIFLGIAALASCAGPGRVSVPPDTTLIILRHGDRTGDELNATGIARAHALVTALDGIPIDAIYSPGIQRNLDTAGPLSTARGLPVTRVAMENPAARIMSAGAGKTVVWIGNSGNLRSIWESLAAPGDPPVEYGDLFFVTPRANGAPMVARRRVEVE